MTTPDLTIDCDDCPESEKFCHGYCEECLLFDACVIEFKYRLHPVGPSPEQLKARERARKALSDVGHILDEGLCCEPCSDCPLHIGLECLCVIVSNRISDLDQGAD
ncbi:MAG: hypothetical protein JXA98_08860 [Methanosarcinaceae archaeon]|nr:hypothetical protein [Methanosarcinaceae archaeon]